MKTITATKCRFKKKADILDEFRLYIIHLRKDQLIYEK